MKLEFTGVSKKYGSIVALNEIDFSIQPGEFVFIVGPSGAGKSTILKLILKQIRPTTGQILLNGQDISKSKGSYLETIRKNIGVIFQDYQLITDKTIEENIALALDIVDYPHSDRLARIDEVLKKTGLTSRRHLFPAQLSGGELQRASLSRALAIHPKLILADEPTGNLDPENSWNLIKLLKDINKTGVSIIMTTHNYEVIESLDKRVITVKNGSIVSDTAKNNQKSQHLEVSDDSIK